MDLNSLRRDALVHVARTTLVRGAVLFLVAQTLSFAAAWAFLAVTAVGDLGTRLYLARRDPELLARRSIKHNAESRGFQRVAMGVVNLVFLVALAIAALDHTRDWTSVPPVVVALGFVVVAAGLLVVFLACRANTFAGGLVTVHENQSVISSGPYGVVRHPMYSGLILMLTGTPLALGSWLALLPIAVCVLALAGRSVDEERFLATSLQGYRDYAHRVRYRVVPAVW